VEIRFELALGLRSPEHDLDRGQVAERDKLLHRRVLRADIFRPAAENGIASDHRVRTPEDISASGREPPPSATVNGQKRALAKT
jgi:hypothetical protein